MEESTILDEYINHHENGKVADNMSRNSINHSLMLAHKRKFMSCYYNREEADRSEDESSEEVQLIILTNLHANSKSQSSPNLSPRVENTQGIVKLTSNVKPQRCPCLR